MCHSWVDEISWTKYKNVVKNVVIYLYFSSTYKFQEAETSAKNILFPIKTCIIRQQEFSPSPCELFYFSTSFL